MGIFDMFQEKPRTDNTEHIRPKFINQLTYRHGNIGDFVSKMMADGVARSSHFDVRIAYPPIMFKEGNADSNESLMLRCDSAELPGRQLQSTDNRIFGIIYKTPVHNIYSEMTMTFIEDPNMSIRKFFETWINSVISSTNNRVTYADEYVTDISVIQYNAIAGKVSMSPVLEFKLIRAFPINVNQLATSWADDGYHKLSVTFFYERYVMNDRLEQPADETVRKKGPPEEPKITDINPDGSLKERANPSLGTDEPFLESF